MANWLENDREGEMIVAIPSYVRSIQSAAFFLPAFSRTLACFCADLKTILLKSIAITSFGVE